MMKKVLMLCGILISLGLVSLFFIYKSNRPQSHIALGVWTQGLFDAKTRSLHPEKIIQFENLTQKKYAIAHYYRGWESLSQRSVLDEFTTLHQHGWQPMLSANPYYFSGCPYENLPIYVAIAQGHCDAFIHQVANNLSTNKIPIYLRFAWEMNNKDLEWSIPYTQSTSNDFIAAWRHIHNIFKEEKVTTVLWVFCPNVPEVSEYSYSSLYPGDAYVDWICLDGYNWGTTHSWSSWVSFSDIFSSAYSSITKVAPNKQLMIGEVNTTDQGGNKAMWYSDMFSTIPQKFPAIKAIVLFNEDRSQSSEKVNWKVDSTKESLEAFKKAVSKNEYK